MKKLNFLVVMVIFAISSCSDPDGTLLFLQEQGYTNIEITGYDYFAKGKDDWSSTGFKAKSPSGKQVTGAVTDKGPFIIFRPLMNLRIWREE